MEVLGQYLSFSSSASFSSLLPLLFFNQSSFILSFRCRFKDIYGTDNYIQRLAVEAQEGGIQAEAVRVNIDAWVAIKVFGSSSFSVLGGEAETVSDVKSLLPQFKKVRTRDIQFGYRLLLHDDDSEPILLLDKTMKHGDKQLEYDDKEKHIELPEIINLEHILTGNMVHVKYETERNTLQVFFSETNIHKDGTETE